MLDFDSYLKTPPLQPIDLPLLRKHKVRLFVLRDDLVFPEIAGNKWHKLKYNLLEAQKNDFQTILSFGGAFSNHIYALASAGKHFGFKTIGIIRGEAHFPLNPSLQHSTDCGMQLHYIDRTTYRKKTETVFLNELKEKFGRFYLLPEGGTNALAIEGCREILTPISIPYDFVAAPIGTGGTLAGIHLSRPEGVQVLGFSSLKGNFIRNEVAQLLPKNTAQPTIFTDFHFGGYAKTKTELLDFMQQFKEQTGIPLEPIYNGKMLFGLLDLIEKGYFEAHKTIVAIHTGGLQGLKGMEQKLKVKF